MSIPSIHVGCGPFSLGRLQVIIDSKKFVPVACVDIDLDKAKSGLLSLKGELSQGLADNLYTTITEAREKNNAEVCFIYVSSKEHANLVKESLNLGMHTLCVKAIACNQKEFKEIIKVHKSKPNLMLVQGQNNQWNQAAAKMREWLQNEDGIGEMLGGECLCWGRQNLITTPPQPDTYIEGLYFHSSACHQLSQLVAAKGLPSHVTAYVHNRSDPDLGFKGVWGTTGGQAIFEYSNGASFCYTGTRVGHDNLLGIGSRWSGQWIIHGDKGDLRRVGGHLILYKNGKPVQDYYLKDLDGDLLEDDRIQFDAFADAIKTGKDRKWMQESSLGTWILMEACNESARKKQKIDVTKFYKEMMGE